ncbi:hypothetical protein ABIA33_001339 [Streptacidiphilus sp. MAP12-16]|uniref:hypothetical protein n=1 Tax=Streptacidiphilus sp. MAP12-16 TaxID=3156300 RepID=UPI003519BCA6
MERLRNTTRILTLLAGFHIAALAVIAVLIGLDLTVALNRSTWVPDIGLIRIDIFLALLSTALLQAAPRTPPHSPAPGHAVDPEQQPHLWQRVTSLCTRTGIPKPDFLHLTDEETVHVHQDSRWLWLRPGTRTLTIGTPLLATLPEAELDALIVRALYPTGRDPHIPLAALLTRSREGITEQRQPQLPAPKGIARQSASALRNWHASHYLSATRQLADQLDRAAETRTRADSSSKPELPSPAQPSQGAACG